MEELRGQHVQLAAWLLAAQQERETHAAALEQRAETVAELQAALQGWLVLSVVWVYCVTFCAAVCTEAQLAQAVAEEELAAVQGVMDALAHE